MRRLALAPILVCALLSPSTALALGVGDIELQSALNQPLDAEIPLRGVSSEERGDIVVTLASEQAFREVGLERPFSLNRLQFEVASRNGSHYVQVSSNEPITEPFLSFLIEVDSPQGNLLREYTVLLDPPVFASEEGGSAADEDRDPRPASDDVDEPSGATGAMADDGDMSGRLADADAAGDTASSADSERPAASAGQQRQGQFDDTPMFLRIAREEEAAERQLAEQAAQRKREREAAEAARERAQAESEPAPSGRTMSGATTPGTDSEQSASAEQSRSQEYGPVQEDETLWDIAERLRRGEVTTQQMMLALLRYNPEAFESNNINRLKQGYVLRVPDADEVRSVSAQQAIAQVREQNGLWREWRDSLQQGDATRVAATQEPQSADGTADSASGDTDTSERAAAAGGEDSRLDIVGADEGGATSDESTSATASNASGTREQLQLAREELASVRSEKEDLSERVEQLESTVDKMEQLVTVREEQLAQLERQLAELREQTGESGGTAGTTTAAGDGAQSEQADAATDAGEAAREEEDDMMVADAADGSGGGDGSTTASGDSGGDAAGDAAAGEGTAGDQASAGEQSAAEDDGAGTQTAASDQQREVVNPADDTQQQERGWLDAALGFLASIGATVSGAVSGLTGGALSLPVIGGAGLAVLALVLLAVRRRRATQAAADDELMAPVAVGEHHAATEPMGLGGDDHPAAESPVTTADAPSDDSAKASLMDEEFDLSGLDVDPEGATPGDEVEQDDTLVEADTYLAYGLHQQAEDLLRLALEEHPDRLDYREKLLETLSAAGKSDEFVSAAEDFHDRLAGSSEPAWQRVSAMGRKVAPDHALFAAGAAAGGVATASSDTGADDDDFAFDLGSEPSASSDDDLAGGEEPGLDLGDASPAATASEGAGESEDLTFDLSDLEDSPPAPEPATEASQSPATPAGSDDGGLDFDLSDLGDSSPAPEPATEASESPATPAGSDGGGLDFDLGDLDLGDDSPSAAAGDAEASTGTASAAADDGLDIDLSDLGTDDSSSTAGSDTGAAPTQDKGEIDLSDFDDPDPGSDPGSSVTDTAAAATGEGELSFDLDESTSSDSSELDDFDFGDPDSDTPDATGGIEDLETSASDFTTTTAASAHEEDPFGGLDDLGGGDTDSGEFDLSGFEQELGEADAAPPQSEAESPAGSASVNEGDDLATMLDLAKAYIDMGDADSASNALEEVIAGGTEEQRAEARSLLETVQ